MMDLLHYPFASKRNTVIANRGMVATSQPLAAKAISKEALTAHGIDKIPMHGVIPVTVPGAPAA